MRYSNKNGLDNGIPVGTKWWLGAIFVIVTAALSYCLSTFLTFEHTLQKYGFAVGFSALLAGFLVAVLYTAMPRERFREPQKSALHYPLLAGALGLVGMSLSYIFMGVWPFGIESVMVVDMHHQYAPLLAQLREMVLTGGSPLYTFETGIGANFISLFAYYLASPFNLLLALLPETLLNEGILLITLLKNALAAALFAACVQYVFRRRDLSTVIFALGYSLSMYMLAYSWNIMWLDGVMMLPLVVLGFERMMREGKYGVYILSLAYTLFTNYYIGFMVCVFLVLYFFQFLLREKRDSGEGWTAFLRFALGSLIAGGMAMCILLPVVFALGYTSAAGESMPLIKATFELFKLPAQQLFGMTPTIRSGNLPNIFCGILPVLLTLLFVTTKTISLRRRLAWGGLLAVLYVSFTVNIFDLIWHGLHSPNDLPYRFSFLYVFAFLMIAAQVLPHIKHITIKQIGGTLGAIAAYIVLFEMLAGDDAQVFMPVYVSLLLAGVYAAILLLMTHRKLARRLGYTVLCFVFMIEMTLHGGVGLTALNGKEYYTDRNNYVANADHQAAAAAMDKTVEIAEKENNGGFYRVELLPRRTCVDTALYHYKGLTSFSSSNYYHTTRLLGALGYADNGVNSYLYHSFVPLSDSLLGVQYVTLQANVVGNPYLEKVETVEEAGQVYYIYRNTRALPLGYRVSADTKAFVMQQYNPFATQEEMLTAMTEDDRTIYTFMGVSVDEGSAALASAYGATRFTVNGNGTAAWFNATATQDGTYYAFVDCMAAQSASITAYDQNGETLHTWDTSTNEPYIIDVGAVTAGTTFQISVTADTTVSGNIYIAATDTGVMNEKLDALADEGLQVTKFADHHIVGNVTATESGTLFTTVPYDASWQVVVDGKTVETYPIGDLNDDGTKGAFLAFDIDAGAHTVELTFIPKGLVAGLLATAISVLAFVILMLVTRGKSTAKPAMRGTPTRLPAFPKESGPLDTLSDAVSLTDLLSFEE